MKNQSVLYKMAEYQSTEVICAGVVVIPYYDEKSVCEVYKYDCLEMATKRTV